MKITEKLLSQSENFADLPVGTDFYCFKSLKWRKINATTGVRKKSDMNVNPKFRRFSHSESAIPVLGSKDKAETNCVTFRKASASKWFVVSTDLVNIELIVYCPAKMKWGFVLNPSLEEWSCAHSAPMSPYEWLAVDRIKFATKSESAELEKWGRHHFAEINFITSN